MADAVATSEPKTPPPPARASKKQVFGVTNPLLFAPYEYNKALFKCNYPFIVQTYHMPTDDKFRALRMKDSTRVRALQFLMEPSIEVSRFCDIKGELGGRRLHSSFFSRLGFLTKPSSVSIQRELKLEKDLSYFYPLLKKRKVAPPAVVDDLDKASPSLLDSSVEAHNRDFIVREGETLEGAESKSPPSPESDKSFRLEEETAPDTGDVPGRGRIDIRLFNFNSYNQKLKKMFKQVDPVEMRQCVCVCECKWEKEVDLDALMQAAAYTCQPALSNLANLHFNPIYILVLTRSKWTYGILDSRGCVQVIDGGLDRDTLDDFFLQQSVRFSQNPLSESDLEVQLKIATKYLRKCYGAMPKAVYPNNTYLVGNLHIRNEWFRLPDFDGVNGDDMCLFYEGLLRIVVGEKVNDWEVEDLEAAKNLRCGLMKIPKCLVLAAQYAKLDESELS